MTMEDNLARGRGVQRRQRKERRAHPSTIHVVPARPPPSVCPVVSPCCLRTRNRGTFRRAFPSLQRTSQHHQASSRLEASRHPARPASTHLPPCHREWWAAQARRQGPIHHGLCMVSR